MLDPHYDLKMSILRMLGPRATRYDDVAEKFISHGSRLVAIVIDDLEEAELVVSYREHDAFLKKTLLWLDLPKRYNEAQLQEFRTARARLKVMADENAASGPSRGLALVNIQGKGV